MVRPSSSITAFLWGSKATTAALIHVTPSGIRDVMVRAVTAGSNTPAPTSVQPGW